MVLRLLASFATSELVNKTANLQSQKALYYPLHSTRHIHRSSGPQSESYTHPKAVERKLGYNMLRSGASRAAFRALSGSASTGRTTFLAAQNGSRFTATLSTLSTRRPQSLAKPLGMGMTRFASARTPMDNIDQKHERELAKGKLEAHPELVSAESSTHPLFEEIGKPEEEKDTDMMAGIRGDLVSSTGCVGVVCIMLSLHRKRSRKHSLWRTSLVKPITLAWLVCSRTWQPPCPQSTAHGRSTTLLRLAPAFSCRARPPSWHYTSSSHCRLGMVLL